jgi:hypothetical protein
LLTEVQEVSEENLMLIGMLRERELELQHIQGEELG